MDENLKTKDIAELQTDITWIKKEIGEIKEQITNAIPHQISVLNKQFHDFQLSNAKWLIGVLVTMIFTLIGVILKFFIK